MAIQFQCPDCQSTIRVPDAAVGKQGTCPHCGKKLLVPDPRPAPESISQEEAIPQQTEELPDISPPTVDPDIPSFDALAKQSETISDPPILEHAASSIHALDESVPTDPLAETAEFNLPAEIKQMKDTDSDVPDFGTEGPSITTSGTSMAYQLKRRRKNSSNAFLMPILFGGVLVAVGMWFFWDTKILLTENLRASAMKSVQLEPKLVGRDAVPVTEKTLDFVLDRLSANPTRLTSDLMRTVFTGTEGGLQIDIETGSKTEFVRVNYGASPGLKKYYGEHSQELDAPRKKEWTRAVKSFFIETAAAEREDRSIDNPLSFRDTLGLNTLVSGLGYNVVAKVGRTPYPCVYEDLNGYLYFLLPVGTTSFQLTGRKLADGLVHFPGKYTVQVLREKEPKSNKPSAPKPEAEMPSEEPEPEPTESEPVEQNG